MVAFMLVTMITKGFKSFLTFNYNCFILQEMTICKLASYTVNTIILIIETFLVVLLIIFYYLVLIMY